MRALVAAVVLAAAQGAPVVAEEATDAILKQGAVPIPAPNGFDQKRHDEIMALPGRADCRVVFMGDSITAGWDRTIWDKEYAPLKALNLGVVCDCTGNVLWRLDQGELDGLNKLRVVVLHIGTNDIGLQKKGPRDVAAGVAAVCAKLREKAPQAKILLMGITPKRRASEAAANAIIARLHDGKGIFFVNINEALYKTPGSVADRVGHLTGKGYEIWADGIRPTLAQLMQ